MVTWTLRRYATVAALALPVLGCAGDAPPVCNSLPGTSGEIAATPRDDENLELLALRLSEGITADETAYQRLKRDIAAIRAQAPELKNVQYFAPFRDTLYIGLDEPHHAQLQASEYHAWDCLNERYGVAEIAPSTKRASATIKFNGRFNLTKLAALYRQVPGVRTSEPVSALGDGPSIYVTPEGDTWHYVFNDASGDCLSGCNVFDAYYFVAEEGASPRVVGHWKSGAAAGMPDWFKKYYVETRQRWSQPQPAA